MPENKVFRQSVGEDTGKFVEAFRENVIRIIGSYSANSESAKVILI